MSLVEPLPLARPRTGQGLDPVIEGSVRVVIDDAQPHNCYLAVLGTPAPEALHAALAHAEARGYELLEEWEQDYPVLDDGSVAHWLVPRLEVV